MILTKSTHASAVRMIVLTCLLIVTIPHTTNAQEMIKDNDKLAVLWVSGDRDVAEKSCLMYTHAAKTAGWFKDVTLIIWGPSAKLAAENLKVQEKLKAMQKDGVVIEACTACADAYGVFDDLKKLGYDVKFMGKPLTDYLKSGAKVLTF